MELDRTKKWFYIFTATIATFIMLLGSWWLYLVFKLADKLNSAKIPNLEGNLVSMVKWEGITFFVLLFILSCALFYFFYYDHKKTKSLHAFFASLTHELKTPLASIRLQSQVVDELIFDLTITEEEKKKIQKYSSRLLEDTIRLEDQLDKHLQLSRLEKDNYLEMEELEIASLFRNEINKLAIKNINLSLLENKYIKANRFTTSLIIKNLFENTLKHNPEYKNIEITITESSSSIDIDYNDFGHPFKGDAKRLGSLFYKFNSPGGSGIGLYLIKKLMYKNNGYFKILNTQNLHFLLSFKKGESSND